MSEKSLFPPPIRPKNMPGEDMAVITLIIVACVAGFLALWKFAELIALACNAIKKAVL